MTATCIAGGNNGTRCYQPGVILDQRRGGLVCVDHAPWSAVMAALDPLQHAEIVALISDGLRAARDAAQLVPEDGAAGAVRDHLRTAVTLLGEAFAAIDTLMVRNDR